LAVRGKFPPFLMCRIEISICNEHYPRTRPFSQGLNLDALFSAIGNEQFNLGDDHEGDIDGRRQ
jgi:hypothetical protein